MSGIENQASQQTRPADKEAQNPNVDAEQLATLAEGKVADAVKGATGRDRPGSDDIKIEDYASDLDRWDSPWPVFCNVSADSFIRKKAEQADAREYVKTQRRAGADVDGSLGQGRLRNEDNSDVWDNFLG